ncbi:hypothetical protein ASF43_13735 [Pseudorhodoferax sp. Leaf267]|nr:hypothetical protein ASF43_13735 [Pseudorhodoferax sp. Leaf267]
MPLLLSACLGDGGSSGPPAYQDRMVFAPATVVTPAPLRAQAGDTGRCPDATQPCFEAQGDILNGKRTLAGIDDMQVVLLSQLGEGVQQRTVTLTTANSAFVSNGIADAGTAPGVQLRNATALGARLRNGPAENLVSLQLWEPGSLSTYALRLRTDGADQTISFNFLGAANARLHAVAADFLGVGTDSLVYVAGDWIGHAAAVLDGDAVRQWAAGPALGIGSTASLTAARFFNAEPVAVAAVTGAALQVQFFGVDTAGSQAITYLADRTATVALRAGHSAAPGSARVVAGHFTDPGYEQIVLAFDELDAGGNALGVTLVLLDRDSSGAMRQTVHSGVLPGAASRQIRLAKGRMLAGDAYEGLAVMQDFGPAAQGRIDVSLVGYQPDLSPRVLGAANVPSGACSFGMESGNFDRRVPQDNGVLLANRNLQLGLLLGLDCGGGVTRTLQAAIWQVSPAAGSAANLPLVLRGTGPDTAAALLPINGALPVRDPIVGVSLAVLDLQGRSEVLGPPRVIVLDAHTQPSVVVAAPPMHVDWVGGRLTNLTAAPPGFFARYTTGTTEASRATTRATTTWSFAAEESLDGKLSYGTCDPTATAGGCVTVEDKVSAKQDLGGSTAAWNSRVASKAVQISQQTAFDDVIWYTDSTLTVYAYPVIGRTTCPAARPACSDAEKVPLTLLVAGPDTVRPHSGDGTIATWYQPPWVAGQVLSYPATQGQLQAAALSDPSQFKPLSQPRTWSIDDTNAEQTLTWTGVTDSGKSVASSANYSGNNTLSVTGQYKAGVVSGSASLSFSIGGSTGLQNLTESQNTVTNTVGLGFSKTAQFANVPDYSYDFTPFLFAQQTLPGAGSADPAADGFGVLQSGFVVDLNGTAGAPRGFWQRNYTHGPDLALLHPNRITISGAGSGSACVALGAGLSACAQATPSAPGQQAHDISRWMRGFFISDASAPGQGGQLTVATAGDQLVLQARVHNLSLSAMPAGTVVKARFYAMPWDLTHNKRTGPSIPVCGTGGPCVHTLTAPVLPYHTDNDQPNWALISQTFDTSAHGGKDLYFWVVVWMEDSSGQLVAEPHQRGLNDRPQDGMDFEQVAHLEQAYGNNVGLYYAPFHILEPGTAVANAPPAASGAPVLQVVEVGAQDHRIGLGQTTLLGARVQVGDAPLRSGLKVAFYDGVPGAGGRLVGMHRQPYLRASAVYDLRVAFHARTCGSHPIHVVAGPGTRHEHVVRMRTVEVRCS